MERLCFPRLSLEQPRVLRKPFNLVEDHAARDLSVKIDPGAVAGVVSQHLFTGLTETFEFLRHPAWRQDEVHASGGDRAARHAVVPGRFILSECKASARSDRLQSRRSVAPDSRQYDPDGAIAASFGE